MDVDDTQTRLEQYMHPLPPSLPPSLPPLPPYLEVGQQVLGGRDVVGAGYGPHAGLHTGEVRVGVEDVLFVLRKGGREGG